MTTEITITVVIRPPTIAVIIEIMGVKEMNVFLPIVTIIVTIEWIMIDGKLIGTTIAAITGREETLRAIGMSGTRGIAINQGMATETDTTCAGKIRTGIKKPRKTLLTPGKFKRII